MCQLITVACFIIIIPEEKKSTLQDMASQRGVACRAQGWKIHLCAAQLRQLVRVWLSDCITLWHCCVNNIPENQPVNICWLVQHDCWVIVWLLLHGGTSCVLWQLDLLFTKFSFVFVRRVWSMMCTVDCPPFKKALFLRREQDLMMTFTESTSSYR